METKNALIRSTFLGFEDHGIFTFSIGLDYGGSGQSAGGYALDSRNKETQKKQGYAYAIDLISEILNVVGVDTWEDLKGKNIRVMATYDKVIAIGNLLNDKWLNFSDFYAAHKEVTP
jgi:hypothetical protein